MPKGQRSVSEYFGAGGGGGQSAAAPQEAGQVHLPELTTRPQIAFIEQLKGSLDSKGYWNTAKRTDGTTK